MGAFQICKLCEKEFLEDDMAFFDGKDYYLCENCLIRLNEEIDKDPVLRACADFLNQSDKEKWN